jgi:hypothetical protein
MNATLEAVDRFDSVPIIIPLADLANHSYTPNASWRINNETGCFEMLATRHVVSSLSFVSSLLHLWDCSIQGEACLLCSFMCKF